MEFFHSSDHRWNYRRNYNPFFIDRQLDKRNRKKKHQDEIFEIYKNWLESPFSFEVDFTSFDPYKLKITFKESFPTRSINKDDSPKNEQEQALQHLNYCENIDGKIINGFVLYNEILEKKDNFNSRIDIFLDCNKESLENLLNSKGVKLIKYSIESLLKFYLKTINTSRTFENEQVLDSFLNGEWINVRNGHQLENRIIDNKDMIIQNIKDKRKEKIKVIETFEKDIGYIEKSILEFQSLLRLIISQRHLGLKNSCIIEKKLSIKNRISSLFHRLKQHL